MPKDAFTYQTICPGIEAAVQDGHVFLKLSLDKAAGRPSGSGKMVLTASTPGGFMEVPGTNGFKLNLNGGFKAA